MKGRGTTAYVANEVGFYAVVKADQVEIGSWADGSVLEIKGALTGELSEELAAGALSQRNMARLVAVLGLMGHRAEMVKKRLPQASFLPAAPLDLIRRDGFCQLWIELLSHCNERCLHCYVDAGPERSEFLELKDVEGILRDAAVLGFRVVQLTGGEPLLCSFLPEAVEFARALKLKVEIFTNGLALSSPLLRSLAQMEVGFAFSLYGAFPEVHDAITQVDGSWELTVGAIERARRIGCPLRIAVVVMEENKHQAAKTVELAQRLAGDLKAVKVDVVRGVGRGRFQSHIDLGDLQINMSQTRQRSQLGKACVAADGMVFPCIFSRWMALGKLGTDGDLAAILRAPRPRAGWSLSTDRPAMEQCREKLTCVECRTTAVLLGQLVDET